MNSEETKLFLGILLKNTDLYKGNQLVAPTDFLTYQKFRVLNFSIHPTPAETLDNLPSLTQSDHNKHHFGFVQFQIRIPI